MKKLARILLAVIAITSMSCEIGLGASVDTEPPSISIDTPEVDSVIRDKFLIGGSWSDDGSIAELKVKIKKTDGSGIEHEYDGKIENDPENRGSGRWSVLVEPEAEDGTRLVIDGTYQATASIKDAMGRITTQSTTFSIDNTPPVIVLTRPSTGIDSVSADTYGQTFNLEGQAADTNSVDLIEVRIYSDRECTNLVHTVNLHQVPNSINMDVAKFVRGNTENDYFKIYGESETGAGEKTFYCRIVAYDGAKRYPVDGSAQSEEDLKGNAIDTYYLYKDIATSLFTNYGLKITEVYSILNGTYAKSDNSRAVNTSDIVKILEDSKKTTGKFSLNPKNNPTFSVTGRNALTKDSESGAYIFDGNEISNGGQVVIEVSPGLDGILLDESSLKVYARHYKDGVLLDEKIEPDTEVQPSGTSYRFITTISRDKGFEIGESYIFEVEGHDQAESPNKVESAAGEPYGFFMASSGKAPQITLTSPADTNSYINQNQMDFEGTVSVELGKPDIEVYVDGVLADTISGDAVRKVLQAGAKKSEGETYSFKWSYKDFGSVSTSRKFTFVAKLGGQKSQEIEKNVVYDVEKPVIAVTAPSTAKKYDEDGNEAEGKYLNGSVEFTVMLNDKGGSGIESASDESKPERKERLPKWEVLDASDLTKPVSGGVITETTGQTITLDTTDEKYNGKTIIFRVSAWDASESVIDGTVYTNKSVSKDADYTYIVDQSTDAPYVGKDPSYRKIDFTQKDINAYYAQQGIRIGTVEKGSTLKFRVYDDDGSAEIYVMNRKLNVTGNENGGYAVTNWTENAEELSQAAHISQDTPGKLTGVSSYTFPANDEDCGFYEYAVIVKDSVNEALKNILGPFLVRITQDKASITVTRDSEYGNKDKVFTNTIVISPSEGPYRIYRQVVTEGGEYKDNPEEEPYLEADTAVPCVSRYVKVKEDIADTALTQTDSLKIGSYNDDKDIAVYYIVIDGMGQASVQKSVTLKIDNDPPSIEIKSPVEGKTGTKALNEATQFSGRAGYLPEDKAPVTAVWYKFTHQAEAGNTRGSEGGYKYMAASNGSFVTDDRPLIEGSTAVTDENGNVTSLCEGKWYFHVYAQDEAENLTAVQSREFDVDLKEPVLNVSIPNTAECKSVGGIYYFRENLGGTITANDSSQKNVDVVFKIGDTAVITQSGVSYTESEPYGWSIPETAFTSGTQQKLSIEVTDWAGRKSTAQYNVYLDNEGPNITVVNPQGAVYGEGQVTITGSVNDGSGAGIEKVEQSINETSDYTDVNSNYNHGSSWSHTITPESQGTKDYWFKATDVLGNESSVHYQFKYDTDNPHLTTTDSYTVYNFESETDTKNYVSGENENNGFAGSFTLSGKAWDTNLLSCVKIFQKKGNGSESEVTGIEYTYPEGGITAAKSESACANWSRTFSFGGNDGLSDGEYTYRIVSYDDAGKQSEEITKVIVVDTAKPSVTFNTPAADSFTNLTAYTFSGTVSDANLNTVKATLLKGTSEEVVSGYEEQTIYPAGTSWSWTVTNLSDDEYKVCIKASDKCGTLHDAVITCTNKITVDTEKPEITMVSGDQKLHGTDGSTASELSKDGRYFTNESTIKLSGTISDTNFKSAKINGADLTVTEGSWEADLNPAQNAESEYKITAEDYAGNTDEFVVKVTHDDTPPAVTLDAIPEVISDSMYRFEGSAVDSTENSSGTGVAAVQVAFKQPDSQTQDQAPSVAAGDWISASYAGGKWNISKDFISGTTEDANGKLCEGIWYIYVKAKDTAGNETQSTNIKKTSFKADRAAPSQTSGITSGDGTVSLNGIWYTNKALTGSIISSDTAGAVTDYYSIDGGDYQLLSKEGNIWTIPTSAFAQTGKKLRLITRDWVGKETKSDEFTVILDQNEPVLSVNTRESYYTAAPKLSGTINDGNGIGVKAVKWSSAQNGSYEEISGYSEGSYSWEYQVEAFGENEAEGTKYIYLNAEDRLGNKAETGTEVTYIYDKSVPSVTLNAASEYASGAFTLSGKAWDTNLLDRVEIFNGEETSASWTSSGASASISLGSTEHPVTSAKDEASGAEWTVTFNTDKEGTDAANKLADGKYTLRIVSYDAAGRKSAEKKATVTVDTKKPSLNSITAPEEGRTGTSALSQASFTEDKYKFKGRAADEGDGSGVNKIRYAFTKADTQPSAYTELTVTDNNEWTIEKTIDTGDHETVSQSGNLYEGSWKLYVIALDKAGNESDPEIVAFDIDKTDPAITSAVVYVSSDGTETAKTIFNANDTYKKLKIKGTAEDSYGLDVQAAVTITGLTSEVKITASQITDGSWSKEFTYGIPGTLADGIYNITVTAKDKVGKTTPVSHKITVDTGKPVVQTTGLKVDDADFAENKWYDSKTLPVEFRVTDATSAIKKVQVTTGNPEAETTVWKTASLVDGTTDRYSATVQFDSDGSNNIFYVKATDAADNVSEVQDFTLKIDTSAPSLDIYKYQIGSGELKAVSGTVYINGTNSLTVYGTYSDSHSGVQKLTFEGTKKDEDDNYQQPEVTYSEETPEEGQNQASLTYSDYDDIDKSQIKYWKAVFNNGTDGIIATGTLKASGKNNAGEGLSVEKTMFAINLDTERPSFTKAKIETNIEDRTVYLDSESGIYYLNNELSIGEVEQKYTISGLASDNTSVDKVYLNIEKTDEDGNVITGTGKAVIKKESTSGNFSGIQFRGTGSTAGSKGAIWPYGAKITITTTDIAGNSTADIDSTTNQNTLTVMNIRFDNAGPEGVHVFDKKKTAVKDTEGNVISYTYSDNGKDLYFRIGDQNRDEGVTKDANDEVILDSDKNATAVSGAPAWNVSKDKDVGGKYTGTTFGNSETVKIRGAFEDKGSSVDIIYYKLYTVEPDSSASGSQSTADFLADYKNLKDGFFSPLKTPETKRVFYTDDPSAANAGTLGGKLTLPKNTAGEVDTTISGSISSGSDTKYYTDIISTFKTTIPGLSAGHNYIALVAVDKVGNAALETVEYNSSTYHNYQINVDYEPPVISSQATQYTKASVPLVITGNVTDKPETEGLQAGIRSVWLKYNETKTDWIKASVSGNIWTATVPAATLNSIYGTDTTPRSVSQMFTATATDDSGSGNTASCSITVTIDKQAPTVEITAPAGAGKNASGETQVNGTIKLKGFASDTNGLSEAEGTDGGVVSLWYRAKAADNETPESAASLDGWTQFGQALENNTEWSITLPNTTFTDETTYFFRTAATDKAGNTGYSSAVALEVNKDTDRPVVKFYMPFGSGAITSANTDIDGVITDDDGTPTAANVSYFITADAAKTTIADNDWQAPDAADAETKKFTYDEKTGSFSIVPGDGTKYIWFKIKDNVNTSPFISNTLVAYSFATPKISDQNGSRILGSKSASGSTGNETRMSLKTDTKAPLTDSFAYLGKGKNANKEATAQDSDGWSTNTGAALLGGTTSDTFRVRIYAFDENGIDKVIFRIPANSEDQTSMTAEQDTTDPTKSYYEIELDRQTGTFERNNKAGYNLFWSDVISVDGLVTGQRACIIDTSDGTKHTKDTYSFNIDNTPAQANFTSHSDNAQIRTSFLLKGGFNDGDNKTTLRYIISTDEDTPAADAAEWDERPFVKDVGANSWSISFDGTPNSDSLNATHDKLPKNIIAELMSDTLEIPSSGANAGKVVYKSGTNAGNLYKDITSVYIHMLASDAIGNSSTSKILLRLDPQGDIPVIKMEYPSAAGTDVTTAENAPFKEGLHYSKLSGYIRAQGTAEDDKNIVGIYMQIDPSFDMTTGTFDDANWETAECPGKVEATSNTAEKKKLADFGYTIEDMYTSYNTYHNYTSTYSKYKTNGPRGIKVGTSSSWNITLNTGKEFNAPSINGTAANSYIAIKFYAVDEDGNISVWNDDDLVIVCVDSDAPKIGSSVPLYLYQYRFKDSSGNIYYAKSANPAAASQLYTDSGCTNEAEGKTYSSENYTEDIASVQYTSNMWLKGVWWLSGSVEDESGIAEIQVGTTSIKTSHCTAAEWTDAGTRGYIFNYPVGSAAENEYGSLTYNFYALDSAAVGSQHDTNLEISIRYDNKVPTLAAENDSDYSIKQKVVNENGFYRVQSGVTEASGESGFDKVVFYFTRGTGTVYNSYRPKSVSGISTAGADIVHDSNLYWKSKKITDVSGNTITVSTDADIHKGGLAKVGGVIYTITNVSGNNVRLSGNPKSSVKDSNALFVIGHVVDHAGTESEGTKKISATEENPSPYGLGYYSDSPDDDEDLMLEKVSTGSTKTLWYGLINSRNIPDGSIKIHYVAFDQAGNMSYGCVDNASVENNGPRLAGLRVWTDYNGDGAEKEDESQAKYYSSKEREVEGKRVQRATDVTQNLIISGNNVRYDDSGTTNPTALMRITDKTRFYPEIVGGNGALYYSYKIAEGAKPTAAQWAAAKTGNSGTTSFAAADRADKVEYSDDGLSYIVNDEQENPESYVKGSSGSAITAELTFLETLGDGLKWFEYTIWDSTEDKVPFTGVAANVATPANTTLKATFAVLLNVDVQDETPPNAVVSPFFWNSASDNSLYQNSTSNGHIELENDLTGTEAATLYGEDPKVSGKIVIRGTAYDDIRLSQLWIDFDGFSLDSALTPAEEEGNPDNSRSDYKLAASYTVTPATQTTPAKAEWTTPSATMAASGWSFTATDVYCDKRGHLVNWELSLDTSKVAGVAALDKSVHVMAVAKRGSTTADANNIISKYSSASASGTAPADYSTAAVSYNKPSYKMDIVPYVTGIETSLSKFNSAGKKGVYDRTALGHYPVYKTHAQGSGGYKYETVTITGFNLYDTAVPEGAEAANGGKIVFDTYEDSTKKEKRLNADNTTTEDNFTDSAELSPVAGKDNTYTFMLPNGAKSGTVHVLVGSIKSLNNSNSNLAHGSAAAVDSGDIDTATNDLKAGVTGNSSVLSNCYNRQPNGDNNNRLTDDLFFDVWDFNSEAAKAYNDGKVDNAIMKISPKSGMIGFAFSNGSERFSMGGRQDGKENGTEYSYYQWNMSYDYMSYNSFVYDSEGRTYASSAGGDINGTPTWDFIGLMSDRWGRVGEASSTNKTYGGFIRFDGIGQYGDVKNIEGSSPNIRKDRFQSSDYAVLRSTNSTYIYFAYYDLLNDEVRFRAGNLLDTNNDASSLVGGQFNTHGADDRENYKRIAEQCQIIATNTESGTYGNLKTLGNAGEYVDLCVTSDNVVVLVWYDGSDLKITWNTDPQTTHNGATTEGWTGTTTTENGTSITRAKTLMEGAGEYCQIAVDGEDNFHIVAYDPSGANLKYAYIPKTTITIGENDAAQTKSIPNLTNKKVCIVDSYLDTGTQLSLDVAKEGNNYIPHIGYWASFPEKPRYAYLADSTFYTNGNSGAISDKYTGVWECGVVPASVDSSVKEGKINVALWKATVNTVKEQRVVSNYTKFTAKEKKSTDSEAKNNDGKCYGNGTDNAVLAYVVMPSSSTYHIETAQMR